MISVIVPVYNGSAYIERCINSITGSTFRDIEIIAVENGSTDNTWEILEALAAGDSRIKPISTEIRGLSNARNALTMRRGTGSLSLTPTTTSAP